MAAQATVSYTAEIKDLRAKLAEVTNVTRAEAKKWTSEIVKAQRAANKLQEQSIRNAKAAGVAAAAGARAQAKAVARAQAAAASGTGGAQGYADAVGRAARSSSDLARASQSVALQLPDVASQLAAGTSASTVFVQQGLQVVQSNMDSLGRVAGRFGLSLASLGPIALAVLPAVIALGAAYVALSADLEEAEDRMKAAAEVSGTLGKAHEGLRQVVADVDLELRKTLGTYDEIGAAQDKRDKQIHASARAQVAAGDAIVAQARAHKEAAETVDEHRRADRELAQAQLQRDRIAQGASATAREALKDSALIAEVRREEADAETILRDRKEAAAAARTANAAAAKSENEAAREAARLAREQAGASAELGSIQAAASLAVLDGQERITEEHRRQIAQIADLEQVSGDHAAAEAARAAVQIETAREVAAERQQVEAAVFAERKRMADQQASEDRAHAAEQVATRQKVGQAALALSSTVANAMLAQSQRTAETDKAAALEQFNQYKALMIAQTAISGAAAAMRAYATTPYPASIAVAALMGVTTAIQIGTIAAQQPSFADTPGVQIAGSSGLTASFAPGDRVIAGRDDADLVRQMQRAGMGGGGGSTVMVRDADRHRGRYGRDPMRPPDRYTPIRRRAGRTPGRR
jgi:hypothetical protein